VNATVNLENPPNGLLSRAMIAAAFRDSLSQLSPRVQFQHSATLGVYVGSICATVVGFAGAAGAINGGQHPAFVLVVAAWLWLSVLLASFAEAIALARVRARAAALRSMGSHVHAKRLLNPGRKEYCLVDAHLLRRGDLVLVEANEVIPADGTVIDGLASVSEAAITGESAPVLRAAAPELASVRCGTQVLSDWLVIRVRSREGFFDPIVAISQVSRRSRTSMEVVLSMLLVAATVAFLLGSAQLSRSIGAASVSALTLSVQIALLVCIIPLTTRACVFAIGMISVARLMRANVVANAGGALEAAATIDVLVLDKTGTITRGDRHAIAFWAAPGIAEHDLQEVACLASLADQTPEGQSIVALVAQTRDSGPWNLSGMPSTFHEFSAQTRISGVDTGDRKLRKGAADAVRRFVQEAGGSWPSGVSEIVDRVARSGATPLVVADGGRVLGVIELHDVVKAGIREHCEALRRMGIRTIMVTGDNPLTAATIAAEIGVDEVLAEATPERKCDFVRQCQKEGHRVAMCGDGTNDAPALAQADVAVAMNSGSPMAKEAGNLVALDSDPTKFIVIVETGKRMRTTLRSLTTFSLAADLAKYFVIIPVVFAGTYPALNALNVAQLTNPRSAILSALICNVLIIAPLLLFVMRSVKARGRLLARLSHYNGWIYGLGGVLSTCVGIKVIDMGLAAFRLVGPAI
jgi:potassium-transporting ATPase ATP-binding subunit